ncbi:MAG TPA: amidohydrolase family protein [Burkholderiales bacterium]|nr:amidohydrolase family protein [Burkholderiales bacterium]
MRREGKLEIAGAGRRRFLRGLAALGAGALAGGCQTMGETTGAEPFRIDIHHHYVPEAYAAAMKQFKIRPVKWSVGASLEEMDKSGIATAMISPPPPGITFGDQAFGRQLARAINEAGAKIASDRPGRFRLLATLPFADIEGSLAEIAYAFDVLKADGISLMTSYGGKYLGDPSHWPILEELNRRKAVVYTHPTTPACCRAIQPYVSINAVEGPVDTTRTMVSLLFQGAAAKFPDIRWIFSHSGGVTPFLLSRYQREEAERDRKAVLPNGLMYELRKFYYDTAQGHHEGALKALLAMVPVSQVLYGTDFPFWDGRRVSSDLAKGGLSAAQLRAIGRENALRLFPQLGA